MKTTLLLIDPTGLIRCIYTELIDLSVIGRLRVERASSIEFNQVKQAWEVQTTEGQPLFQNASRAVCIAWEAQHFVTNLQTLTPRKSYA